MMDISSPSLKKQSTYLFAGQIFSLIFSYIVPIILVRILTLEEYGLYRQFHLITLTFIPILSMGLGSSLLYFYPIVESKDKSNYVGQTYLILFSIGAIFLIVYYILGLQINEWIGVGNLNKFRLLIPVYTLFMIVSNLSDVIFTVEKKIRYNLFFFPIDKLIRIVLLIVFGLYFKKSSACIYALLLYSLVRFGFITKYLYQHIKNTLPSINLQLIKKQMMYSLPFAGAILANTLGRRIDKLLVNNYITVEEYAVYSVAFFSLPLISQTTLTIQAVVVPKLSNHFNSNNIENAKKLWKKSVTTIASINIPIIIFFWIIAEEFYIFFYTEKYIDAAIYFRLYLIVHVFHIFLWGVVFRASNNTKLIFIVDVICLPIIVISGLLLISNYGVYGAVFTAIIGNLLPIIIKLIMEKNILELSIDNWLEWNKIVKIIICSSLPVPFLYLIKGVFSTEIIILILGASIYFLGVFILENLLSVFVYKNELLKYWDKIKLQLWLK